MRIVTSVVLTLLAAAPLAAQDAPAPQGPQVVDRVVAVVGDTVLLLSDVQAAVQQFQAEAGQPLPDDPRARDQIVRQIIDGSVAEMVLLQAAKQAGVVVRDELIGEMVDQEVRAAQGRFASETEFRAALGASGMTLEQYRSMVLARYRDRATREQFLRQRLANRPRPSVSETEIRELFAASGSEMRARPATISLEQVIVTAQPAEAARAAALATAQDVLGQIQRGGDFEVLARRFSDDPGSRQHGGDLGWFRQGRMVPAFERAVYALRPGQVSPIVETDFGFHIIRLERVRGTERQARHILIRPEITDADRERARARADSIAGVVRVGAPMPQLRMPPGMPADQRVVDRVVIERLPPEYTAALADVAAGGVAAPFQIDLGTDAGWVVARVTGRQAAGSYTIDDVREQIVEHLQVRRMEADLVEELSRSMHIDIRI